MDTHDTGHIDSNPRAQGCVGEHQQPNPYATEHDPEILHAALTREISERRRAECLARMQADVVQLALDLLVREPDIDGFFGALTKTMVEEGECHTCAVWLIEEDGQRCVPWMAYVKDRPVKLRTISGGTLETLAHDRPAFPCDSMATHLFEYSPVWTKTVEYSREDDRLPTPIRQFSCHANWDLIIATPLLLGSRTLGWMTVSGARGAECDGQWWRVVLIEAIARQAALALHHSRVVELNRLEERRKAILEERNRLARDIHDNLAQGFAAILMQLQGAQREAGKMPASVASGVETAVELARAHLNEARRSVGTLRPNVSNREDIVTALKRLANIGQRTGSVPIDVIADELPRFGDGVEREIIGIAQEALTNAVRHSRARRITVRASTVQAVGFRLSVADDGRGIARERSSGGFGMTSMQ